MIKCRPTWWCATAICFSVATLAISSASAGLVMRIDTENNIFYIEGSDTGNAEDFGGEYSLQFLHYFSTGPSASFNITATPEDLFEEAATLPITAGNMNLVLAPPSYVFIDLVASSDITSLTGKGSSVTVSYAGLPSADQTLFESMIGETMSRTIGSGYSPISVQAAPSIPDAPTITEVVSGNGTLSVAFTAGADNGSAITNYQYSLDGGDFILFDPATISSPVVISGLTNGTAYAVRLQAINSAGASTASNAVSGTPIKPPDKIFHSRFAVTD